MTDFAKLTESDFEWNGRDKTATFGPLNLRIVPDDMGDNPFTQWDCQTPVTFKAGRGYSETWDHGDGILDPLQDATPAWVARNRRAVYDALCIDAAIFENEVSEWMGDGDSRSDMRADMIRDSYEYQNADFDTIAALWELRGVPALSTSAHGYSQGDYVEILAVATPEHAARCGWAKSYPEEARRDDLETARALLGAWMFGDVYGYVIEGPDGEELDSCFGFYGCPWGNNPEKGDSWAVLDYGIKEALGHVLESVIETAESAAREAREAFTDAKAEFRALQATGTDAPRLCQTARAALAGFARDHKNAMQVLRDARAVSA